MNARVGGKTFPIWVGNIISVFVFLIIMLLLWVPPFKINLEWTTLAKGIASYAAFIAMWVYFLYKMDADADAKTDETE